MQWRKLCCGLLLALLLAPIPALAQFGVGIGGWGWGGGGGGGIGIWGWPRWGRSPTIRPQPYVAPSATVVPAPVANGLLSGRVVVSTSCASAAASGGKTACPLIPNALDPVTISALPAGGTQWLTTRPNPQGVYQFSLPPGTYTIQVQHPYRSSSLETPRIVTINPGQTHWMDIQLDAFIE